MHDQAAADDRLRAVQADDAVLHVDGGDAVRAGLNIAKIADMAFLVMGPAVLLGGGIEMAAGALRIGAITELVDVEAVLARLQTGHLAGDVDHVALLREFDDAGDVTIA